MRQALLGALIAAFAVAGLAFGLRRLAGVPEAGPIVREPPVPPAPHEALAPESAPASPRARPSVAPDSARGAKRVATVTPPFDPAAPSETPLDSFPSLDELMKLAPAEPAGPQSVDWLAERERPPEKVRARRMPGLRIDYSRRNETEGVPMQAPRHRTDVDLSVPLGESERLRLKGGVRVEERQKTDEEREADATPTVGVEVRF